MGNTKISNGHLHLDADCMCQHVTFYFSTINVLPCRKFNPFNAKFPFISLTTTYAEMECPEAGGVV